MCVPNLSVKASGKGLCDVMGLHGWLDCPHCAGTWLSPVPLADVPMDTAEAQGVPLEERCGQCPCLSGAGQWPLVQARRPVPQPLSSSVAMWSGPLT